ncbi:MAG: phospho-N-acetylmuramoyl-pentapeptide-transferase [Oscillospiraceae bacterium]|nr:phospho-N-acetylmuramoyl-pentapeptide-transferase [Oscillospiraceae bacterium]
MADMPMVASAVIGFGITAVLGIWLVPLLRKLKYGQTILDIGPSWHKHKQGIPTMGGIMLVGGIAAGIIAGLAIIEGSDTPLSQVDLMRVVMGILMAAAFGLIGFTDDYIKVAKKRNLGLTARQKLMGMFVVAGLYLLGLYVAGDTSTIVFVPFLGQWDFGLFYYPAAMLGIVFMVNVVNFNDGVDGLCSSVTFVVCMGVMALSALLHFSGMSMFAAAVAGGCLGFLVWNYNPAKIFMGDTGSFFLGGCVVAMGFGLGLPVYLGLLGIIYIIEGVSVMIQMMYFKATRRLTGTPKRLFKMTPIHHHYEMLGWSEGKIVAVFSAVQLLFCGLAVYAAMRL